MRTSQLLSTIIAASGITSAWPWPPSLSDLKALSGLDNIIQRRQGNDNGNGNGNNEPSQATSFVQTSASPQPSLVSSVQQTPAPNSRHTTTGAHTTARTTATEAIVTNGYPGGVNILKPNTQFGGSQYYAVESSVESTVTWVWNYTSLAKPPSHIDVVATMASSAGGLNPSPFTLGSNLSFAKTQTFMWDTGEYAATSSIPNGIYTLNIFDADAAGGATAIPKAGGLTPFRSWNFGVYSPLPYYALEGITCITCNAAGGQMEKLVWGTLVGTVGIAMGTMAWFAGIAGLW